MNYAPIAIFTFNRPDHLEKTLESLIENKEAIYSELFLFIDGPRTDDDLNKQNKIRHFVNSKANHFYRVEIIQSSTNKGLASSITNGIQTLFHKFDRVIILEDDLKTSKYFLSFMNHNLALYENDANVASIHGYMYPIQYMPQSPFFLRGADCWGWATWKRAWLFYENDGMKLLKELKIKQLENDFNYNSSSDFFKMLEDQVNGKNNSWAIKWYASCYLKNLFTLYPQSTLVQNIGLDGSGTHCDRTDAYFSQFDSSFELKSKIDIVQNEVMRKEFGLFFKSLKHQPLLKRFKSRFAKMFNN